MIQIPRGNGWTTMMVRWSTFHFLGHQENPMVGTVKIVLFLTKKSEACSIFLVTIQIGPKSASVKGTLPQASDFGVSVPTLMYETPSTSP